MKFKNLTLSVLCAVTLAFTMSCNSNNGEEVIVITDFPQPMTLDEKIINLDSAMYLMPLMYKVGDFYLSKNITKAPEIFTVYNEDFKYIESIVSKGDGPDQVLSGKYFNQWSGDKQNPQIQIYDFKRKRISTRNLATDSELKRVLDIPVSEFLSPSSIYYFNDTSYVGINLEIGKCSQIFIYNPDSKNIRYIPNEFAFDQQYGFYVSQSDLYLDLDHDRIIEYYYNIPWILIYDSNFNLVRKIALYQEINPELLTKGDLGIVQLQVVGDNLICLIRDISQMPPTFTTIVMNSNGDVKSVIDKKDANSFIADTENDRLIFVCYDDDKDEVFLRETSLSSIL